METFIAPKKLVENPHYHKQRQEILAGFTSVDIDAPIIDHINCFNQLPFCFTLQCCYGHFLYSGQNNPLNLDPLLVTKTISMVEYRIAYIAFCIENSDRGMGFFDRIQTITSIDYEYVQLCCAEWFWKRQVNSYVLQIEPDRFKHKDNVILSYREGIKVEKIRIKFFKKIMDLLQDQLG